MDDILLFLSILMAGLSALLIIVSFASYSRLRNIKLLLVGFAFIVFFIKAILLILEKIAQDDLVIIIDFTIIVLLYFSVIKK